MVPSLGILLFWRLLKNQESMSQEECHVFYDPTLLHCWSEPLGIGTGGPCAYHRVSRHPAPLRLCSPPGFSWAQVSCHFSIKANTRACEEEHTSTLMFLSFPQSRFIS